MHRARCVGLVLCAIALLVAGCTSSNGGDGGVGNSPIPTGLAGSGANHGGKPGKHHHHRAHHGKHHHKGGGSSASHSASPTEPAHSSAPGGGTATHSAPHPRTSSPHPHSSSSSAPHPSLPTVAVTPSSGLSAMQTVTVEGFHFPPNTLLTVAECHDRGQDTGLPDCNINNVITYAPGAKVRSDANGHVGPLQITVRKTFKEVNCGTQKCLVAISKPTLQPQPSDEGDMYIHFA